MQKIKTIFIVNPASGKGMGLATISAAIKELPDCDIYTTVGAGDATRFVREYCLQHPDETTRFCACGGDGTLFEVVNGAAGFDNAEVTCFPCGSGNDFVKYYGGPDIFRDAEKLVSAGSAPIDLMQVGERYSINVVNFGFDTNVCKVMNQARNKPIIGGRNAYTWGIIVSLITAMKNKAKVYADGELLNEKGTLLLCTVACGKYVGGKYCCAPRSKNDDGMLELCLIKPVSRLTFLSLIGKYEKGLHLDDPKFKDLIIYRRCKKVEVVAEDGFSYTMDGEVIDGSRFTCEVSPAALKFASPTMTAVADASKQEQTV